MPRTVSRRTAPCLRLLWLALAVSLAACTPSDPEPTVEYTGPTLAATTPPPRFTPDPRPRQTQPPATPPALSLRPPVDPALPAPNPDRPLLAPPLATPSLAAPVRTGVRPAEVIGAGRPALPTAAPEWRPPPYDVPLALHPDDHYWLIRPIASGRRNYDLEIYPFGNDVLLAELAPYRVHHGLDFPNDTGTPVLAAASGTVIFAGELVSPRDGVSYYGNTVIIEHDWRWRDQTVYTLYAHTLELLVTEGEWVEQGQLIAGVGASGEVSGPHLHLEIRIGENNYYAVRNPALWLAPYQGYGTLAGRFVDESGRWITSGRVVVRSRDAALPTRTVLTYYGDQVKPDEVWRENFVVADLPAGRYVVDLFVADRGYRRNVNILPGRTNFMVVQADIPFVPTPTPTPALTPTVTGTLTTTVTIPATATP